MIIVVAYDISKEENRGKIRRYLGRMGLSIVNRSVYAGYGSMRLAKRIAEKAKNTIEGNDNVFIIVVREEEYARSIIVTSHSIKKIEDDTYDIL